MKPISTYFRSSDSWNHLLLYGLFCFSTFSIAGSEISILGLHLIFIWQSIKNPSLWRIPHATLCALLIFWLFNILSGAISPYSVGVGFAIRDNLRLFLPVVLYCALSNIDDQKLIRVFFFFLILVSIYGIIQYFTGADWFRPPERQSPTPYKHPCYALHGLTNVFHAKGNYTHHLTFGGVLLLCFPLFVSLSFCRELSIKIRCYYGFGIVVIFTAILASLARSIWFGSAAAMLILCLRLPKKWLLSFICIGVGMLGVMIWQYTLKAPKLEEASSGFGLVWQRLESSFVLEYNKDRLLLWETAWQAIKDHPWFGIGLENDAEVMPQYREALTEKTGHQFFNSASAGVHNIYLQTWINLGILGLLSYLAIWVLFFRETWKTLKKGASSPYYTSIIWGGCAGVFGFLVAGMFENNFRDSEVQIVLLLILAISLHAMRQCRSAQ